MPSLSKKQVFLAALTAALLLVLITFFTVPAPVPHALQVNILERTNNASGTPTALVSVTNHTGQARFFYGVAEIPNSYGWTTANGQQPRWQRLAAHAECGVLLPAPPGGARWKVRCTSMPEVSKPEEVWYLFVRRTGLNRIGVRGRPLESYVWTAELGL